MCLGEDETTVYAAGVDPKVIEFAHVSAKNSVWKMTRQMQRHSHDIRAIGLTGGKIFSGGALIKLAIFYVVVVNLAKHYGKLRSNALSRFRVQSKKL